MRLQQVFQVGQLLVESENGSVFVCDVLHKLRLSLQLLLLHFDPLFALSLVLTFDFCDLLSR